MSDKYLLTKIMAAYIGNALFFDVFCSLGLTTSRMVIMLAVQVFVGIALAVLGRALFLGLDALDGKREELPCEPAIKMD